MPQLTSIPGYLVLLALGGCASGGVDTRLSVGDGVAFELLSPASFGQSLILTQVVTLDYGQASQQLLFYSEITAETISIAGLLPSGTRLFSIRYDGQNLQSTGSRAVLDRLDPRYLLADMQIALWPLAALQATFDAANSCFSTGSCQLQETTDQLQRTLGKDGNTLIAITYQGTPHHGSSLQYTHRGRGYTLQIETVNVELPGSPSAE